MKSIVKTTGAFSLMTPKMIEISRKRPHVVAHEHFIDQRTGRGDLRILAQVNDDATDAEFKKTWEECEGDETLAIASFTSEYPHPKPSDEEAPVEAPDAEAKAEAEAKVLATLIGENPDKLAQLRDKPQTIGWWYGQMKKALDGADFDRDAAKAQLAEAMPKEA